jgi:hypothetical protein
MKDYTDRMIESSFDDDWHVDALDADTLEVEPFKVGTHIKWQNDKSWIHGTITEQLEDHIWKVKIVATVNK